MGYLGKTLLTFEEWWAWERERKRKNAYCRDSYLHARVYCPICVKEDSKRAKRFYSKVKGCRRHPGTLPIEQVTVRYHGK